MGLKRNCPLNHDQLCRFLPGHISLTLLPVLLVSSFSRSLDLSNLTDGSQACRRKRDASERFPRVPMHDRQFVCREDRTKADGTRRKGPFAPSCRKAGLPSISYVVRRLNKTTRWIGSPTRMRPSLLVSSHRGYFISFPSFRSDGGQEQPLPEPSNLCPKTKNSFGFQTYVRPRRGFRIERLTSSNSFSQVNIIQIN